MKIPGWLPLLLGVLTAVGPVSTDMYLPAFPAIEASLGGRPGTAQITLATWFAGLAVGQITQGTLSDRYGRRGPLLIGTIIYTLASIGCAMSTTLTELSTFRFLAALGGSASMVIPRAVVRDICDGHAAVRMMSKLMLIMGVTPILAPSLGGFVLDFASWHTIFWIAALYGAACSLLVWRLLPDTLPQQQRVRLGLGGLASRYAYILTERSFITSALVAGFLSFTMFAYLGGSPAVFIDLFHLTPSQYGMLFGGNAFFYILGSQLNARVVGKLGLSRTMTGSTAAVLVATATMMLCAYARIESLVFMVLPLTFMWLAMGFLSPSATVSALSRHSAHAASASALLGMLQYTLGAVSGLTIALMVDGTARPMANLLLIGAIGCMVCNWLRPRLPQALRAALKDEDGDQRNTTMRAVAKLTNMPAAAPAATGSTGSASQSGT